MDTEILYLKRETIKDWSNKSYTKEQAKEYILTYGKDKA